MIELFKHPLTQTLIGTGITWLVAWFYYKRAGDELKAEAKSLHTATAAIVYFLEHPDASIKALRDEQGHITGLVVNISGTAVMSSSAYGTLTDAGTPNKTIEPTR